MSELEFGAPTGEDGVTPPQLDPAMRRMQMLIDRWEAAGDHRVVFLRCYQMMTSNMLAAIDQQKFHDSAWVGRLLHRFANYYFNALDEYEAEEAGKTSDTPKTSVTGETSAATPPLVWQLAHNAARHPGTLALQNLLLGVNAHINYDLVLALVDILEPEWNSLPEDRRILRYEDHCHVNLVIGNTIDAVQEQVIDPVMPIIDVLDKLMGPVDEIMISRLLTHWRESVWRNALRLLETQEADERASLVKHIEKGALELGEIIQLRGFHPQQKSP
jgi:hypothetical protein